MTNGFTTEAYTLSEVIPAFPKTDAGISYPRLIALHLIKSPST